MARSSWVANAWFLNLVDSRLKGSLFCHDQPPETVFSEGCGGRGEEGGVMAVTHCSWTKLVWPLDADLSEPRRTITNGQLRRQVLMHGTEKSLEKVW